MSIDLYIDLLNAKSVRSPTSAARAARPDFRNPGSYTLNLYFLKRADVVSENFSYTRFASGTPNAKLRRNRAPDYCTFVLSFMGYNSDVIDARLPVDAIAKIIGNMPSVGLRNVHVTGDISKGFQIEFVDAQGHSAQPAFTGKVITPTNGEIVIDQLYAGGVTTNAVQKIILREAPLITATGWAEIGVPTTPGWSATLNTAAMNEKYWNDGDLILEVTLEALGVRSGADGATVLEATTRSGADGQTVGNAAENAQDCLPLQDTDGTCWLVAKDGISFAGLRMFSQSDVGKTVGDSIGGNAWIRAETIIDAVVDLPYYNAARLNQPFADGLMGLTNDPTNLVHVNIAISPTRIYKSATAAFVASDVGHGFVSDKVPAGTIIQKVIDATTIVLSQAATGVGTALNWSITAIPSNLFNSASAAFVSTDLGAKLEAPQLPGGTYITAINSGTQVQLSQKAIGVASGQAWTLRSKSSFAAPSVTSIVTGSLSLQETQRIALVRSPIGGILRVRDGGDLSLPWAEIQAPLDANSFQGAMNAAYINYGGVLVAESAPKNQYDITWGVRGQQHILVIDDTFAIYDTKVAQIPVGDPGERFIILPPDTPQNQQQIQVPNTIVRLQRFGLNLMGVANVNFKQQMTAEVKLRLTDGTQALSIRARFAVVMDQYAPAIRGEQWAFGQQIFYLDAHENVEDKGGLRFYDWVGYTAPKDFITVSLNGTNAHFNRRERIQQTRPVYIVPKTYLNGHLVDIQLASVSVSTWAWALYRYYTAVESDQNTGNFADSPAGSVIHFVSIGGFTGVEVLWALNGFNPDSGTYGAQFPQSWARRRWHSTIWEEVLFWN